MQRRERVRVHLADGPGPMPSIEGILIRRDAFGLEVAVPVVLESASDRHELDSRSVVIKHSRVAFYERLRGDA
jgi:hypothetical protein